MKMSPRRPDWPPSAASLTALAWLALAAAYLATRLYRLASMPLFVDEGTTLWFGRQVLLGDLSRGWGHGKPLSAWIIALPLALGVSQALAARLGQVLISEVGLAAACHLASRVLSPRAALATAIVWLLTPYTLFFERLATPDVLLGALVMLALDLAWQALHADRVRLILVLVASAAFILVGTAKLPVSLFFFGLPAAIWLVSRPARTSAGRANTWLLSLLPALFAAGVVAIGIYRWSRAALPIGFGFDEILGKSAVGAQLGGQFAANLTAMLSWGSVYLGWPLMLALGLAWVAAWFGPPLVRLLAGLAGLWLVIFVSVASYWVPRYVWPALPALLVIVGWAMWAAVERLMALVAKQLPLKRLPRLGPALIVATPLIVCVATMPLAWTLLTNPSRARLPAIDQLAYVTGLPSGFGFPEAAAYLDHTLSDSPSSQVIMLDVSDEARLRAYLAPRLWPRLRQAHVVGGQNQDALQKIAWLKKWLPDADVTYVVLASGSQWSPDLALAFPLAAPDAQFPKPGGQDAVQVIRIATP